MYAGYYEGGAPPGSSGHGYPHQHPRDGGRSKTPPFQRGPRPSSAGRSAGASQPRSSPVGSREGKDNSKTSPEQGKSSQGSPGENGSSARASPTKVADEMETERLRQAALTEISPAQVEPIKTAFHFFVMDMRDTLRREAEAEVQKSLPPGQALDSYLVNSNLNCRLMEAWENVSDDVRQNCMTAEEADRRRAGGGFRDLRLGRRVPEDQPVEGRRPRPEDRAQRPGTGYRLRLQFRRCGRRGNADHHRA